MLKVDVARSLAGLSAAALALLVVCGAWAFSSWQDEGAGGMRKGYDIKKTGLVPVYPMGYSCPPLTSLYASWVDVDGTHREEIHSGVDGGGLGDWILAPADGTVKAVWEANWRWGKEGALLLTHTAKELNLKDEAPVYYSAFDHLKYDEVKRLKVGQKIRRGERLAHVYRPGGHTEYLPEVHWEVWEADDDDIEWKTNRYGAPEWRNEGARLIDPLYMLGLHSPPSDGRSVAIVPFEEGRSYEGFRGFTYIFSCPKS